MTRRSYIARAWWVAVSATVIAVGCGERRPATYPVEGRLRFEDGRPVPFGTVEFRSAEAGITARGTIDSQGRFRLGTFAEGDGAIAAEHQAIVVQNVSPAVWQQAGTHAAARHSSHGDHSTHDTAIVPRRYADYATSDLSANVRSRPVNRIELTVSRQ